MANPSNNKTTNIGVVPIADHPAAWVGEALLDRDDWIVTLTDVHVEELHAAVLSTQEQSVAEDAIAPDNFVLPTLGPLLKDIQESLENGGGATMVRGLPIDTFTETDARRLFFGIGTHVGTPLSQSADGQRLFSVRNEGYRDDDARARGPNTAKRLSFHTDRCDVIAFLCLKQAKAGGDNLLVSSMALYNRLPHERTDLVEALMQPFYYKRHNVDLGNASPYCQQPVFAWHRGVFAANLLRVLINRAHASPDVPDLSPVQVEALDALEQLAEDPTMHVRFRQEPGDMLLLNNWVTMHRRDAFEDHDDLSMRRHILRLWLSVPNSREIDPRFAGNYGNTAAGAVRGGMRPAE